MLRGMLNSLVRFLARLERRLKPDLSRVDQAIMEPFEHPAIRVMTIEQQADLPVDRSAYYEGLAPCLESRGGITQP